MKHMYISDITEDDFDFMKNSQQYKTKESLLGDYIAILCSIIFLVFIYQHIQIDISLSLDNLLNPHSLVFKHKIY